MPRSAVFWLTLLAFVLLVAAKYDRAKGFTTLLRFGEPWATHRLPAAQSLPIAVTPTSTGYDGQFYAQIALSPALRDPALETALDAPAYRARRILGPFLAHCAGLGRPWLVLNAFAILNVACWLGFAWLLWREITDSSPIGTARWLACVLSLGILDSVRQSLVDLPALLFLLLAVRQFRSTSPARAALALALGNLTKETNLLASLALLSWPRPNRQRLLALAACALPIALWAAYVAHRFPAAPVATGSGNFTWPFVGAVGQLTASLRELSAGNFDSRHSFTVLGFLSLALQAVVLWRHREPDHPWWRIGAAYSILLLFLGPWVWTGYWAACRAVLPLTIAFNLLLPTGRGFWPLLILGNLTALHGVWRFL
ncbi:MAG: hypothetical protein KF715_20175 [Candidatus Didemnitutus sp.]|nr:hypothetical protein [Candidatus Didemnitutus sp.]